MLSGGIFPLQRRSRHSPFRAPDKNLIVSPSSNAAVNE